MKIKTIIFALGLLFLKSTVAFATIKINRINTESPKLYEKFQVVYELSGFNYDNPYDPDLGSLKPKLFAGFRPIAAPRDQQN